jgi:hypothetical protein
MEKRFISTSIKCSLYLLGGEFTVKPSLMAKPHGFFTIVG